MCAGKEKLGSEGAFREEDRDAVGAGAASRGRGRVMCCSGRKGLRRSGNLEAR